MVPNLFARLAKIETTNLAIIVDLAIEVLLRLRALKAVWYLLDILKVIS